MAQGLLKGEEGEEEHYLAVVGRSSKPHQGLHNLAGHSIGRIVVAVVPSIP